MAGRAHLSRARLRRAAVLTPLVGAALAAAPVAAADIADETALAERYAPVVRIVEQAEQCGHGEPYQPIGVDLLFGEPTVALRGPWSPSDLVRIGPAADDLVGAYEHHLDYPGNALSPGCDYEHWGDRLTEGHKPAVYAHVVSDPDHPGTLALQYWFFWVFNDFNNTHEGDWEMIQLEFDARDAREALAEEPVAAGYSSHEGAERADWGDDKLELVGATHPVIYPASGSHANKFGAALYLGSSAEAGVGCDDTRGPHTELEPAVLTIPSDPAAARAAYPWIAYEGRWGELQKAFFNGPTGPNMKTQWTAPATWSEDWRTRSYAVPTSGIFGTSATDFFCVAVETGSKGLAGLLRSPGLMVTSVAILLAVLLLLASRTTWRPAAPLRVAHRRAWGQILSSALRMYVRRAPLYLGIGVLFMPLAIVISVLQALVLGGLGFVGADASGESAGALVLLVVAIGATLALLGLVLVQAATAHALVHVDEDRPIGPFHAYRLALRGARPLLGGLAIAVVVVMVLSTTAVLAPVAVWLAVRWALLGQVVALEGGSAVDGLRRSAALVRGRWWRVASLVGVGAVVALVAGPFIGALLILATEAPLPLLNVLAGVVYGLAMPLVALTTTYVYSDARTREALPAAGEPDVLPAEIELRPA